MAVYEYTAKDQTGDKFSGVYDNISNAATLRKELDKLGYSLIDARPQKNAAGKHKRIKRSEIVAFAYKFAGMYGAGLSILRCLETMEQQTENHSFKNILTDIRQNIEIGASLENAFSKYRDVFSDFFLGMVKAGEAGGKLATSLEMSAVYLEKQAELKRKIKSAFAYPVVVSIISFTVIGALMVFFVPVFLKLYKQLNVTLPGPTQTLVCISSLITNWWPAVLIAAAATAIGLRQMLKNPAVRTIWDSLKLNVPVFGRLNRMVTVSHFIRTFAMLASVGIPLVEALRSAAAVVNNHKMTEITVKLQEAIEAGNPVAKSLAGYNIFPPIITQLAASGEEAGMLPDMLNKGADFLDKDIERTINALLLKLEPALTVIMGIVVGFLLLGVYLPMFDYMSRLK